MKAIVLLAVILAALTLACANETVSPSTTTPTDRAEELPSQMPEADESLRAEVRELRDEVQKLQGVVAVLQEQAVQERIPEAAQGTAAADVCGRFPALQYAILNALNLGQCSLATYPELFRIERLSLEGQPIATPLKSSDFAGLVNLTELSINFVDSCGQWDDIAFTDAVVAELPSLVNFDLDIYRPELDRTASTAEEIANAVFLAIHNGQDVEPASRDTESNESYMYARITGEAGVVSVEINYRDEMLPCRSGRAR